MSILRDSVALRVLQLTQDELNNVACSPNPAKVVVTWPKDRCLVPSEMSSCLPTTCGQRSIYSFWLVPRSDSDISQRYVKGC